MIQRRSVSSLPLGAAQITLLNENGFSTVDSLEGMKPLDICRAINCSQDVALQIWKSMQSMTENCSIDMETAKVCATRKYK